MKPPMRDMEMKIKELSVISPFHSFEFVAYKAFPFGRLQMNVKVEQDWSLLAVLGNCLMNMA